MAETNTKLLELIDDLVASKTFSLDALDHIKALRDNAAKLAEENTSLKERNKALQTEVQQQGEELRTLRAASSEVQAEKNRQIQKDHETALLKKELSLTQQFKGELKEVVMAAFKNPVVRQDMFGSHSIMQPNGCMNTLPMNSTTTTQQD
jgi:predicted nuclease with TOPRIM domain